MQSSPIQSQAQANSVQTNANRYRLISDSKLTQPNPRQSKQMQADPIYFKLIYVSSYESK